jgi:UDP-glucose 4-epimerase
VSRVLVTGAAGFIGSHLVDRLLEMGHEVTGVDCFIDYYSESTTRRNLSKAIPHKRFRFVEGDLLHLDLEELTGQVDRVAHLAGEPEVRSSWRERFSTYLERNARTTQLLLEAVAATETEHFVLASSSSVYGSYNGRPVDEDAPKRPASPYGMSKLAAEELVGLYGCERGVPATVACVTSPSRGRASVRRWPSHVSSRSP